MTTIPATAIKNDPCPGCDDTDSVYWVTSTPDTDVWACRRCASEWTITVCTPGG